MRPGKIKVVIPDSPVVILKAEISKRPIREFIFSSLIYL